jgi:hypothetical protein
VSPEEKEKMNEDTLKALQGSIAKWEAIVAGTGADGYENCPLCARFNTGPLRCARGVELCPVRIASKRFGCDGTPYEKWAHAFDEEPEPVKATTPELVALAQAELDFLKSLLP